MSDTVMIDERPLGVDDVVAVARGAPVALGPAARERIAASRAVVDRHVEGPDLVYGLNTGLGHLRNERVPVDVLRAYQDAILVVHDGGIGPPLPVEVVRAAMVARVAGIAVGGAGASPALADALVAMLNAGVHPVVPAVGSVGAADLMHMTSIALVATGHGRAEYEGEVIDGAEALRRAGLVPVRLEPKDGLASVSANGMSIGYGALVASRAAELARLADLVVSLTLEAVEGNVSIVDPVALAAKAVAGQIESGARIRAFLSGSPRFVAGAAGSVQDALSLRVAPQVHGAFVEFGRLLRDAVETELAAADDNPLVAIEEGRLISNGNFHPMVLALAADALRPAAAHVALLSEHRLEHLWRVLFTHVPMNTPEDMANMGRFGAAFLRYTAAALYAELRSIADPVTLDVPPLDLGIEDHATNAALAVSRSDRALELVEDILAIELLIAGDTIAANTERAAPGAGVAAAVSALADVRAGLPDGTQSDGLHAAVRAALRSRILPAAEAAVSDAVPAAAS